MLQHHYVINNCTELLELLSSDFLDKENNAHGWITFQGDDFEFGGIGSATDIMVVSPVYKGFTFGINRGFYEDDTFTLSVFRGPVFVTDQALGITLPKYVGNELISTILGKNYPTVKLF